MYILSVKDVIKNSVVESFSGTISTVDMLLSLIVSFLIGIFIIYVYRKTYTGVVYSKAFSLCILMLALVTAMIIRTISSNIALSLGMVGALSIVRFRTAVKEPVDTGFMFWGISAGIMAGAGLYVPALVASLGIGILYFICYSSGFKTTSRYLLVLKYESKAHDDVMSKLKALKKVKIRSKSIYDGLIELSLEVDVKDNGGKTQTAVVDQFESMHGMVNASLIAYQ